MRESGVREDGLREREWGESVRESGVREERERVE